MGRLNMREVTRGKGPNEWHIYKLIESHSRNRRVLSQTPELSNYSAKYETKIFQVAAGAWLHILPLLFFCTSE